MRRYRAFGMDILSEIALDLPEQPTRNEEPSDRLTLRIERGEVPLPLELPFSLGRIRWACGPGRAVVDVPWAARCGVEAASRITVDAIDGAGDELVSVYILGFLLLFVLGARGLLALHGSAVCFEKGAAVFAGPSGSGKSTLAGALCRRGRRLLCDDLVAIGPGPVALPGVPVLRLLPDSFLHLGGEAAGAAPSIVGEDKRRVMMDCDAEPPPIGALYVLRLGAAEEISIRPLTGMAKVGSIIPLLNSPSGLRTKAEFFEQAVGALGGARVYAIRYRPGLDRLGELAEAVDSHFEELA